MWDRTAASVYSGQIKPEHALLVCEQCHDADSANNFVLCPPAVDQRGRILWPALVSCKGCYSLHQLFPAA